MKLSGNARRKLSQGSTGGIQQPGHMAIPMTGGDLTKIHKRPRSKGSNPSDTANPSKKPRDFTEPRTYREALTKVRIAILKENCPEEYQQLILAETMAAF
jgi:hypothetical protein